MASKDLEKAINTPNTSESVPLLTQKNDYNPDEIYRRVDNTIRISTNRQQESFIMKISSGVFFFVCIFFDVTNLVFSVKETTCDWTDPIGLNTQGWLLLNGIFYLLFSIIILGFMILSCLTCGLSSLISTKCILSTLIKKIMFIILSIFAILSVLIGGIVLIRSNMDCFLIESTNVVVYAFVFFLLQVLSIPITVISIFY